MPWLTGLALADLGIEEELEPGPMFPREERVAEVRAEGGATMNDLYRPMFLPDLLIAALERNGDRPAVHIDGDDAHRRARCATRSAATCRRSARRASSRGDGVATLSKNRVEVLYSMGAVMVAGCRNTPLHPLGSLDDHAYVLEDAGIETLLFDPQLRRPRAASCASASPGCGACCRTGRADVGDDLMALAATFEPQPLVAPPVDARGPVGARLHGRHDRQAQGRDEHLPRAAPRWPRS